MEATYRDKLLARINRKDWWHVPPAAPKAYQKRGKFLASTFREAEFWGRPLDTPVHVRIANPIVGDDPTIETELLGAPSAYPGDDSAKMPQWRWNLDTKWKKAALAKGYDSIVTHGCQRICHPEKGTVLLPSQTGDGRTCKGGQNEWRLL